MPVPVLASSPHWGPLPRRRRCGVMSKLVSVCWEVCPGEACEQCGSTLPGRAPGSLQLPYISARGPILPAAHVTAALVMDSWLLLVAQAQRVCMKKNHISGQRALFCWLAMFLNAPLQGNLLGSQPGERGRVTLHCCLVRPRL